jgi:hypothetical protein
VLSRETNDRVADDSLVERLRVCNPYSNHDCRDYPTRTMIRKRTQGGALDPRLQPSIKTTTRPQTTKLQRLSHLFGGLR